MLLSGAHRCASGLSSCHKAHTVVKPTRSRPRLVLVRARATPEHWHADATKNIVRVTAEDRLTVPVSAQHDAGCDLAAFMRLPVSQFVLIQLPLGGSLQRVGADLFEIVVPQLSFFGVWVQPRIKCTVRQLKDPERVDIQSIQLVIEGSDLVRQLRLTDRVDFHVQCQIMAQEGASPAIHSSSSITALVDTPAYFSWIPSHILESTGSAVVKASLSHLHKVFMPSLAADYTQWSRSEAYREQRVQHAHLSDSVNSVL